MKAIFTSSWDFGTDLSSVCEIDVTTRKVTDIESLDVDDVELFNLDEQYVTVGDLKLKALNFEDFQDLWIDQECECTEDNELLKQLIAECDDFQEMFTIIGEWSNKPVIQRVTEFLERNEACYFED